MNKYVYTFAIWPAEDWGFKQPLYEVFKLVRPRVEMPFTEDEFERFRSQLNHDGFTVQGIVRVPYHKPEVIV